MIVKIPTSTKQFSQLNEGDLLGTLFSTRNIDLKTPGILKLAQRTRYVGQTSSGDLTDIFAIIYGNFQSTATTFQYWLVSDGGVLTLDADLTNLTEDGLANTPTPGGGADGCQWNGNLYVSKQVRVSKLAAGTWTASWSSADFGNNGVNFPHPIEPNVTNNNLLVGDGNLLKKIAADGTISVALTLPANLKINWIRRGIGTNYIGLDSVAGGVGAVAIWDGLDTTLEANSLVYINARTPLSGCLDDEGVFSVLLSDSRLVKFNSSGFTEEAELAPFRDYLGRRDWGGILTVAGRVLQRGMYNIRGQIHIAADSLLNNTPAYLPNFPGGIYVYDKDNKAFYHKYAPSNANTITDFGQTAGTIMVSSIFPVVEGRNTDPAASVGGVLISGGRLTSATISSTLRTVISVTTGENRGQFVINRIESDQILDEGVALWCKFQGINTSTDKIVFKYRTKYRDPIVLLNSIPTWASTTVFTTSDTGMASVEIGDEITILQGNGAGQTAHIVSSVLNAGTYTVTIDEAMTGISSTNNGRIMVENYKKLSPIITNTDTKGYKKIALSKYIVGATWIQIKGEMRGEGGIVGIQELQVVNKTNVPSEQ